MKRAILEFVKKTNDLSKENEKLKKENEELKKKVEKLEKLAFITLTAVKGGEKDEKTAIKVDDILLISDASNSFGGRSIIYMNPIDGSEGLVFFVKETLEDILEKISKGDEE